MTIVCSPLDYHDLLLTIQLLVITVCSVFIQLSRLWFVLYLVITFVRALFSYYVCVCFIQL